MRRTLKLLHGHRHGYLVGGLPVAIEKPNREQRRAAAKQAKKRAAQGRNPEQPEDTTLERKYHTMNSTPETCGNCRNRSLTGNYCEGKLPPDDNIWLRYEVMPDTPACDLFEQGESYAVQRAEQGEG